MKNIESNLTLDQYNALIEYLRSFMLEGRFATLSKAVEQRTDYLTILTENMFHPQNASAVVRHCEAFGIQHLHTVENLCKFSPNVNIVRGTDKWIDIVQHSSTTEALQSLKNDGYRIVATTPHRTSCTPETFDVKKGKFALVFGTEKTGISSEVMEVADDFLMIPMQGMVESINVSACAAILIYMLSRRLRTEVSNWQLSEYQRSQTLYKWCYESVADAEKLIQRFTNI